MLEKPSTLEYLKSLKVNTTYDKTDFEVDNLKITVVMFSTNKKNIVSSSSSYDVELLCNDNNTNTFYSNCFNEKFIDEKEAREYYELLINKIKDNNKDKLLKAIKDDDISFL